MEAIWCATISWRCLPGCECYPDRIATQLLRGVSVPVKTAGCIEPNTQRMAFVFCAGHASLKLVPFGALQLSTAQNTKGVRESGVPQRC